MSLLDEAIEAAGGRQRWSEVGELSAHIRSGGLLLRTKGKSRHFADYEITVDTRDQIATLTPFPKPGRRGIFAGDRVWIESDAGEVLAERKNPRDAMLGLGRLRRAAWWDDLDALYFAGYAMWGYLNAPFLLERPEIETEEVEPYKHGDETWRQLRVRFPEGFHTHSHEQAFFFDAAGLLRRNDYSPNVVAPFANAVHISDDHERFDGITVATRRRATPRGPGDRQLTRPAMVWISLADIRLTPA